MREYDRIAEWYAAQRSADVGIPEVKAFVATLPPGARVLDAGCGDGIPLTRLLVDEGFDVVGVDSSAEMIARFRRNFPAVKAHVRAIQDHEDQAFDAAIAWGVLFHLPHAEQEAAIARVASLVVTGGRFLFTSGDEESETEGAPMNGVAFRYWSFGVDGYRALLARQGFELVSVARDASENTYYVAARR